MRYNLRHLRVFLAVADTSSVTRAAKACHVSQPAVTQSISKLETTLGAPLFTRTPHGLFLNAEGEAFSRRVCRAFAFLDPALSDIGPRLRLTATAAQMDALMAVRDTENFTLAARRLGLAQPTVHRAVAQLEKEAGRALFERTGHGIMATRATQALARLARLAFLELEQAEADLAENRREEGGRLVIGSMPLSRSHLLPTAIARFRTARPRLAIQVVEGPYGELLAGLRRGDSDILVGALRDPVPIDDVEQETLFHDTAVIVAGMDHPLARREAVTAEELGHHPWVVALRGTPIRAQFDALFETSGVPGPRSITESGSLILMRELLDVSDHLGFVSGGQAEAEIRRGLMVRLPLDLAHTRRPIGITTRRDWMPTVAQQEFVALLREVGAAAS
jgi:LysR family transcriptional regulator, regulator for genes of the gallate degradation pathway